MFAYLGEIMLGVDVLTGPTGVSEGEKSTFARLSVAEGKPVTQDRGDELATRKMEFFFDESFCEPEAELARLRDARQSRSPMPLVGGDGTYTGACYVIEGINVKIKKTTPLGRIVRVEASLDLIEKPVANMASLMALLARILAPALIGAAGGNVRVRK